MRTRPHPAVLYRPPVLTDAEADEIRVGVESGLRGPAVIKWIRELLEDRDQRLGRPKYEAPKVTGQALRRPRRRPRPAHRGPLVELRDEVAVALVELGAGEHLAQQQGEALGET